MAVMKHLFCLFSLVTLAAIGVAAGGDEYIVHTMDGGTVTLGDAEPLLSRHRRDAGNITNSTTSAPMRPTPSPTPPRPTPQTFYDNHKYYKKMIVLNQDMADNYKRAFKDAFSGKYKTHQVLSNSHRIALQVKISFDFLFYGNIVNKVTIATGGFLYMSHYLHRYLTYSQYIAPLMADFDTGIGAGDIYFADTGDAFYVMWKRVHLKYQTSLGAFTFETILHKNGTILFAYHEIPTSLSDIATSSHVVKVGIADAFYEDKDHPTDKNYYTRRIQQYHAVEIRKEIINSKTVVILNPVETCVQQKSCPKCLKNTNFDCAWCSEIGRCSSGTDRLKQKWESKKCHQVNSKDSCPVTIEAGVIILIILIVLVLLFAIGAFGYWVYYAYSHPATPSGMWLMEHRPSVLASKFAAWRRGGSNNEAGDIYRVGGETTA